MNWRECSVVERMTVLLVLSAISQLGCEQKAGPDTSRNEGRTAMAASACLADVTITLGGWPGGEHYLLVDRCQALLIEQPGIPGTWKGRLKPGQHEWECRGWSMVMMAWQSYGSGRFWVACGTSVVVAGCP